MSFSLYWRLSILMLLQYWIWGGWGSYLSVYLEELGLTADQSAIIMSSFYLASMISPFIGGQIADRYMSTEKFLGIAHILGGVFLMVMAEGITFYHLLTFMLLYSLMYAPTLPLSNSICFQNLTDVDKDFGKIRVWGTLGWIFAGWALTAWLNVSNDGANCIRLAGIASIVLGVLSFLVLPHTPPAAKSDNKPFAFLEALKLLKSPSFAIFMVVSFVVSTELMFYYFLTGPYLVHLGIKSENIAAIMTIGQGAEILTLVIILPYLLPRVGIKTAMLIGIIAWPLRYIIFAVGTPLWLVIGSLTLHGFCYVFFFVVGQIYVDRVAPKDIRGSAQSLLAFITFGLGLFSGTLFAGRIRAIFTTTLEGTETAVTNWTYVFIVPVVLTALCAVLFVFMFKEPKENNGSDEPKPEIAA